MNHLMNHLRLKPIFRLESWHLAEIAKVGGQQQCGAHDRGGCDFQVLGSDPQTLFSKLLKKVIRWTRLA
jgi:hypothetical protein